MTPLRRVVHGAVLAAALLVSLRPAAAFVPLDPDASIETSPRWSAAVHPEIGGAGVHDGIQVAVSPGFATALVQAVTGGSAPQDLAAVEAAVAAAFVAWQNAALTFDVTFDGPAVRGLSGGAEIDLFAVPDADPAFVNNSFFGVTHTTSQFLNDRQLTNGTVLAGRALIRSDIFLNLDMLALFAPALTREQQQAALQRLMMHEIGHAIGLHHPNEFAAVNLDTDNDPLNAMVIDPTDPHADLVLSPAIDSEAVMSNGPSFVGLLLTALRNDDRGGRDVLYPELGAAPLCAAAPRSGCRGARRSVLVVERPGDASKDRLTWKWVKGAATDPADFGDPRAAARYALCVYSGAAPALAFSVEIAPDAARWMPIGGKGFAYADSAGVADGVRSAVLKSSRRNRAKLVLSGKGTALPDAPLPAALPLTAQMVNSETSVCWEALYGAADVVKNSAEKLKAVAD